MIPDVEKQQEKQMKQSVLILQVLRAFSWHGQAGSDLGYFTEQTLSTTICEEFNLSILGASTLSELQHGKNAILPWGIDRSLELPKLIMHRDETNPPQSRNL